MTTIAAALQAARGAIASAEARLLLRHVLGRDAAWLEAHRDDRLSPDALEAFAVLIERRAAGEPVAYLLGFREFYGREFSVTPAVLIPRPETELLVEVGLAKAATPARPAGRPQVLDLGTGSGCVAVSLALELPDACVTAVDVSPEALAVAHANATLHGAAVSFAASDWFANLGGARFDLIVGNPPYIRDADPHLAEGDLCFEPALALSCGADGLEAIRHILEAAPRHLEPGGWIFLEHGYDQADALRALLAAAGLEAVEQYRDLAGIIRVSGGRLA